MDTEIAPQAWIRNHDLRLILITTRFEYDYAYEWIMITSKITITMCSASLYPLND